MASGDDFPEVADFDEIDAMLASSGSEGSDIEGPEPGVRALLCVTPNYSNLILNYI